MNDKDIINDDKATIKNDVIITVEEEFNGLCKKPFEFFTNDNEKDNEKKDDDNKGNDKKDDEKKADEKDNEKKANDTKVNICEQISNVVKKISKVAKGTYGKIYAINFTF